jgi:hypothetical protein
LDSGLIQAGDGGRQSGAIWGREQGVERRTAAIAAGARISYRFKPTEAFWESFYDLPPSQKESVRRIRARAEKELSKTVNL